MTFCFVGERRSPTAIARGWTWRDGRLAAKQLFDALRACGIDPLAQLYYNVQTDDGDFDIDAVLAVRDHQRAGVVVVAMGAVAQRAMRADFIPCVEVYHPAARGRVRGKAAYAAHLRERLCLSH